MRNMKNKEQKIPGTKEELSEEVSRLRNRVAQLEELRTKQKWPEKDARLQKFAIRSTPTAISFADMEGYLTYVNPAFLSLWGYREEEEVLGKHTLEFWADSRKSEEVMEIVEKDESWSGELLACREDGSVFNVEVTANVIRDEEEKPVALMFYSRDITKRVETQKELEETLSELKRSNRELEQFAYVASHDLQEPLRMISSFTRLLEKRYGDRLDDDAREFIDFAVDGATRMQKLVSDLLQYSRITTRGEELKPISADLALGRVRTNLAVAIEENGGTVTSDDLPKVYADESQLVSLFQNLIQNALKFRGEAEPRVHVSAEEIEDDWRFSVRDNGLGIEPQYRERIFGIFERLQGREKHGGTGIGLALCRRIVNRHGGRIWVGSRPGEGSTFYFTIPRRGGQQR